MKRGTGLFKLWKNASFFQEMGVCLFIDHIISHYSVIYYLDFFGLLQQGYYYNFNKFFLNYLIIEFEEGGGKDFISYIGTHIQI